MNGDYGRVFRRLEPMLILGELVAEAAAAVARNSHEAFRLRGRPVRQGCTMRPGKHTPLWNQLRRQIRAHLRRHGTQASLARILGIPRQRVNEYFTRGHLMPDAERTLQLIAWLLATRADKRPR